ncbi:hypothetical protein EMIT0196P_20072 [Pseudomonas chlororaphis]
MRLAAWIPAMRATANTSPLGWPPPTISRAVSARICTQASATASRKVTCLSVTSTMRARPRESRWVSTASFMDRCLSHGGEKRDGIAPASHTVGWQRDYCAGPRARLMSIKKATSPREGRNQLVRCVSSLSLSTTGLQSDRLHETPFQSGSRASCR